MRLVDADNARECFGGDGVTGAVMQRMFDSLPTIDAVPVVRCRECKFYREFRTKRHNQLMRLCYRMGKHDMEYPVKPDDFCSYGQRKEDNLDEAIEKYLKIKEEANMDKPRICEVLGVEVGERFSISPVEKQLYVSESGNIIDDDRHLFAQLFVDAINHPDRIIRKPRFTQQEVESAKIISVLFPEATHIGRLRGSNALIIIGADNGWIANIENSLFQEIKSGQSVTLDEIIGGAE